MKRMDSRWLLGSRPAAWPWTGYANLSVSQFSHQQMEIVIVYASNRVAVRMYWVNISKVFRTRTCKEERLCVSCYHHHHYRHHRLIRPPSSPSTSSFHNTVILFVMTLAKDRLGICESLRALDELSWEDASTYMSSFLQWEIGAEFQAATY